MERETLNRIMLKKRTRTENRLTKEANFRTRKTERQVQRRKR